MVDIVMTSASDFENISNTVMDTSENENKNPIQNENRDQHEDEEEERKEEGEEEDDDADEYADEMEEGEIFDDDDNKEGDLAAKNNASNTSMLATAASGTTQQQSPSQATQQQTKKGRDLDREETDYRWSSVHEGETHHHGTNQESHNEFGDSDYRSISPRIDRRRRRSPSPGYGGMNKRIRGHSPPMRGSYRGRGFRGRWGDRQICKFFREGYCRDGENCSYSHDAADSSRKPELCKFYQQGFCKKGLQCPLLHGEYPCKAFHKGECSKDPCQFSHVPLNNFTQPIFDQMMKDDELASRIAIPQAPLKRRVLIPGGPSPNAPPGSQSPVSSALTAVATINSNTTDTMLGGVVPPPSVVVPTLSTSAVSAGITAVTIAQPQLVIPPALATTTSTALATTTHVPPQQQPSASSSTYPVFLQHAHLLQQQSAQPGIIDPNAINATSSSNALISSASTMPQSTMATTAAMTNIEVQPFQGISSSSITEAAKDDEDDGDTSFNINKMLEQITSKVKKDDIDDISESPASPPMFGVSDLMESAPTTIPQTNIIQWKLIAIDDIPSPHSNIDASILQQSITDSSLRNDPRIKKALSSQFDAFTNSLMRSTIPPSQQQSTLINKDEQQTLSAKAVDPRVVAVARDPRKRSTLISDPRTASITSALPTDPRIAAASSSLVDPRTVTSQLSTDPRTSSLPNDPRNTNQTNGQVNPISTPYAPQTASTSSAVAGIDQMYAPTINQRPSSRDQDHRGNSSIYRSPPSHYRSSPPTQYPSDDRTGVPLEVRRGSANSTSSWMPQMHAVNDPRFGARRSRDYGNVSGYGTKDRDDRELPNNVNSDGSGNHTAISSSAESTSNGTSNNSNSTNTSSTTTSTSSRAPISLREKRKNNEYESPLSRVPSAPSRWQ